MENTVLAPDVIAKHQVFWQNRAKRGDKFVGHVKQDHEQQALRIMELARKKLGRVYFEDGLDFGCGYGRFEAFLGNYCGHVWAADLLPELAVRAADSVPNATAVPVEQSYKLRCPRIDFLWSCLVLQHITDQRMFELVTDQLRGLLKPKATVLLFDNAVDKAGHVKSRTPEILAQALGVKDFTSERVTINKRADDHWLIFGTTGA